MHNISISGTALCKAIQRRGERGDLLPRYYECTGIASKTRLDSSLSTPYICIVKCDLWIWNNTARFETMLFSKFQLARPTRSKLFCGQIEVIIHTLYVDILVLVLVYIVPLVSASEPDKPSPANQLESTEKIYVANPSASFWTLPYTRCRCAVDHQLRCLFCLLFCWLSPPPTSRYREMFF